ncbi:hypothetical protein HID58_005901 [Brassica napus]|uniref:Uncharacterized protein n=1 Tax=Brassica napus TaxID=3708 RepID=A0ABQ8ECU0_BRANA|nr:hypothetical protein HID58_005901 [Brassica napus]
MHMNTLFYFLLASTAVLATTANASEPVVDADGDLISDGSYYAVPVSDNEAGPKPETGKDSSKSFFQIKKAGDFLSGYKFVYCRNDKSCYEFGMVVDRYGYNDKIFNLHTNPGGPILDNDGYVIFNGSYLVRPIIFGGGLTLSPLGDNQCPLYIEQQFSKDDIGYPIRFSNWGSGARFVPESENLNVEMVIPVTTCVQSSTYWWVTATEGSKWLFISAGPKPDPGEASSKSFFQIKKVGDFTNGYKIMFCSKDNNCIDVGIVVDEYGMNPMFYFLLVSTAVLAATAKAGEPVVDTDGNLISNGSYYAVPVSHYESALTLASGGANPCPLYVGPELSRRNKGLPLRFLNWGSGARFVPESENLNIKMDLPPTICAGPKPETGKDSSKSSFQIKKAGGLLSGYKFVYCGGDKSCYEFGMVVDRYGYSRLAPSNLPFRFVFVKAD